MNEPKQTHRVDTPSRIRRLLRYTRELDRTQRRWRKALIAWLRQIGRPCPYAVIDVGEALQTCRRQPLYSLIVPIVGGDRKLLTRCLQSVQRQLYTRWELIAVPVGPQLPAVTNELGCWPARDARVRVCEVAAQRSLAAATNLAISQTAGEFVGLLEPRDELSPDALLWMAVALNRNPRSRWFYSDEATLDAADSFVGRVQRKPAYSWEYLLATNYASRFAVYDRQLLVEAGGLRNWCQNAQDHDLALRASEIVSANEVTHIPELLYFRREISRSTGDSAAVEQESAQAAYRAVSKATERRALACRIEPDPQDNTRFQIELSLDPRIAPKVAIVIPTYNAAAMLRRCVESLSANTAYPNYEIVIIDNRSNEPELARYLAELAASGRGHRIAYPKPFNHSEMHNEAIAQLDAEQIVLLNNDVYAFSRGWLEQLVATIELDPAIAGVGGKLFYPDGTIQHAGLVIGSYRGLASNVGGGAAGDSAGYFGRHRALQQVSGVTAAMMVVRRSAFLAVGGFDAQRYPTSYNDVDLWLRLGDAGFRCLFNPAIQATHEESKTRRVTEQEFEFRRRLQEDLARRGWRDPYWNLALFGNPDDLLLKEKTGAWIFEKMQALGREVDSLRESLTGHETDPSVPPPHLPGFQKRAASQPGQRMRNT